MINSQNTKQFDLEERTTRFARQTRDYVKSLPRSISHLEYAKQVIRSSGSVAANYIEANEALGDKDFKMRIRICRKEAKESRLWIELSEPNDENQIIKRKLIEEATELIKIFSAIIKNTN